MDYLEKGKIVEAELQARFDRVNVTYKTVNNTPIETAIFIPKTFSSRTEPATAPVLVHFHGGGLVTGSNPDFLFLVDWVRELAHSTNAIFISPAYRLAPETPAVDILDDIADFWTWLHADLPATIRSLHPHLTPDLSRLAAVGESAGGYLALQSAFLFNRTAKLRAIIAQYPALHTDLAAFNPRPAKPDPALDAVVAEYVKGVVPGTVRTSTAWPGLAETNIAALTNGLMRRLFGADAEGRLTLGYALRKAEEVLPPVWVVQGDEDELVAKGAADELVERVRAERPGAVVKYTVRPGGHGFDGENTLADGWVAEGVEFVKGYWLA